MSRDLVIIPEDYKEQMKNLIDTYNNGWKDSDKIRVLLDEAIGILGDLLAEAE